MAPRTRSASKPRDNSKPEASRTPRKRQRVGDPEDVDAPFERLKLGPTKRAAVVEHRESKKRKLTNKRKANTKDQGKLTVFTGLPLDALSEVTSFLLPVHILQLSRVSTNFRELFNPHTARHFWIEARRNVPGLPECPADLNEAQYASLLFEHHCQACGTPRADNIDFVLRHRTCKSCHKELTKRGYEIVEGLSNKEPDSILFRTNGGIKDPNPLLFRLVSPSCISRIPDLGFAGDSEMGDYKYNIRELTSVIEQYKRLNSDKEKQMRFVQERKNSSKMMTETGKALLEWHNSQKEQKKEEDRVKSEHRLQEAKTRLLELGWTQRDVDDVKGNINKLMYVPRELTPRIWSQSLAFIESGMFHKRRHHRWEELNRLWKPILRKFIPPSEWIFFPAIREISNIPCVCRLSERDNANVELTSQALEDVFPDILRETQSHRNAVKRIFLRQILDLEEYSLPLPRGRKTRTRLLDKQISPDDPRLFYARHLFYCGRVGCNQNTVMTLSMFNDHIQSKHDSDGSREYREWVVRLVESDTIQDVIKEILKVMGLREDVRVEDVERFDQKLQCECDKQRKFGFVSLIQHFYDREPSESHLPSKVPELVSVR